MGHITLRTTDREDALIEKLRIVTGVKTATGAIKTAIGVYEHHQSEIRRLQAELAKSQNMNDRYRNGISAFREAQSALLNLDKNVK